MEDADKTIIQKMIDDSIRVAVKYTTRKFGDTPTDTNQLTPQKYVDLYGTISGRPSNPNPGQRYFVTELKYPIFTDGVSSWFSATGSIVASI